MAYEFWAGIVGVVVGGGLSIGGVMTQHYLTNRRQDRLDAARKKLLRQMLEDKRHDWRKLTILARVIGADEDTTKRVLLEIDARGSEAGDDVWALISLKPLP